MAWFLFSSLTAKAEIYGWIWNQSPPQYASVGDTFEVSATLRQYPSGEHQAGFCISDPDFSSGFDPGGARVSAGTERIANGLKYQPMTITSAGNGSLSICAVTPGGAPSGYAQVTVRTTATTLSSVAINGDSEIVSGQTIDLGIAATASNGSVLFGGAQSWSSSPSSYASISQTGLLSAQATDVARTVTVSASYTYLGITKSTTKSISIIPRCVEPIITPGDGTTFDAPAQKVSISTTTTGAQIYFTTNGVSPTTSDTAYTAPFNIFDNTLIKAIAIKSGCENSPIASADIFKFRETAIVPIINSAFIAGTTNKVGHRRVVISSTTPNASIYYTLNDTSPNNSSLLYVDYLEIFETTIIKAIATKQEYIDSAISTLEITNIVSLADAVNLPSLNISSTSWGATTNTAYDGLYATLSGTTADNSTNTISASIEGAGNLSFWWKASCEDDSYADNWDYLVILVDREEKQRIDGITSWEKVSIFLPSGTHNVQWEYRKDSDFSAGEDCGWIDNFTWVPFEDCFTTDSPTPIPYTWLDQHKLVIENGYESAANSLGDNGYFAWESYLAGLNPTNPASSFITSIFISNGIPQVRWTPDLGSNRVYTIYGKTNITDPAWTTPANGENRFFKVKVEIE